MRNKGSTIVRRSKGSVGWSSAIAALFIFLTFVYLQIRPTYFPPIQATIQRPFFRRYHSFDCSSILHGRHQKLDDVNDFMKLAVDHGYVKRSNFYMYNQFENCSSIRSRHFYPTRIGSSEKESFPPVAFAVIFYGDLEQFELLMSSIYHPGNQYAVHVDLKETAIVHLAIARFASCFDNIHVAAKRQYAVHSRGKNMIRALMSLLELLTNYEWNYVLTLQANDFPIRTTQELVHVLRELDGSNDVELLSPGGRGETKDWSWRNEGLILNADGIPVDFAGEPEPVHPRPPIFKHLYKGSTAATLSRSFVQYILQSPKTKELMEFVDNVRLGDELFFSTLNHAEEFRAPGGYPGHCLVPGQRSKEKSWISRFTIWAGYKDLKCQGKWRHTSCVFSLRDLPTVLHRPELFANKFMLSYDPIAAYCAQELLFNRTYVPKEYPREKYGFNLEYYRNLSSVDFQRQVESSPTSGDLRAVYDAYKCKYFTGNTEH